jgi:transcriptional regulator with XRE-family HTH domain
VNQVTRWTGLEATLLRLARRMTVREFASHLGITSRTVTKWTSGGRLMRPRAEYQTLLDESLRRCTEPERERFGQLLREQGVQRRGDGGRVRWCLMVDLSPGDLALMSELERAVKAVLDGRATSMPRDTYVSASSPGRH